MKREKRYNNDAVKTMARELLGQSLDENLLTFNPPSRIKVLHFAGWDNKEYEEVYCPRNIPIERITSLEMKKKVYDHQLTLESMHGMDIQKASLEDFLSRHGKLCYNVVSLDFTGNLTPEMFELCQHVGGSISSDQFVYHMAMQGSRESGNSKDMMQHLTSLTDFIKANLSQDIEHMDAADKINLNGYFMDIDNSSLSEQRNLTMNMILDSIGNGMNVSDGKVYDIQHKMMKKIFGTEYNEAVRMALRQMEDSYTLEEGYFDKKFGHLKSYQEDPLNIFQVGVAALYPFLSNLSKLFIVEIIEPQIREYNEMCKEIILDIRNGTIVRGREEIRRIEHYMKKHGMDEESLKDIPKQSKYMAYAITSAIRNAMFGVESGRVLQLKQLNRYAYISESGTPMLGDIAYFVNDRHKLKLMEDILECVSFHDGIKITDVGIVKKIQKFYSDKRVMRMRELLDLKKNPRQYLGSSAKPVLRKSKAIQLLQGGESPENLSERYRGLTVHELAGLQAYYVTRQNNNSTTLPQIDQKQSLIQDLETRSVLANESILLDDELLDKDDAIEYFRAGISPKEIFSAYPKNSLPQLNAWKFWFDRNKYAPKEETVAS